MDTSLEVLVIAPEDLACLPLGFRKLYSKRTVGSTENEASKLQSRRFDAFTQEIAQPYKPISLILDR